MGKLSGANRLVCAVAVSAATLVVSAQPETLPSIERVPERPGFVLFDPTLRAEIIDLTGFDSEGIAWIDSIERPRRTARDRAAAIVRLNTLEGAGIGDWASWGRRIYGTRVGERWGVGRTPVVLDLVDRQRLIGSIGSGGASGDDLVRIDSPTLGEVAVSIDRIARVTVIERTNGIEGPAGAMQGPDVDLTPLGAPPGTDDRVTLDNGDVITGFVLEVADPVVLDSGGEEIALELARVRSVEIASERESAPSAMVWLNDGSRVAGTLAPSDQPFAVTVDLQSAESLGAGEAVGVGLDRVVAMSGASVSVVGLASIEPDSWSASESRRWSAPPESGPADLEPLFASWTHLPGLMDVSWTLPTGAARLRTLARLGEPLGSQRSAGVSPWSSSELVFSVEVPDAETGERSIVEVARYPMTADQPSHQVVVDLPMRGLVGRRLLVSLVDLDHGPVQDRVTLERPLLLLMD